MRNCVNFNSIPIDFGTIPWQFQLQLEKPLGRDQLQLSFNSVGVGRKSVIHISSDPHNDCSFRHLFMYIIFKCLQVIDEPLFLMHHVDIMVSVTGSNLLQGFRESLLSPSDHCNPNEKDDDEDVNSLLHRLYPDTRPFEEFMTAAQGCLLLLMLKQHLKELYGLTDAKITQYFPSEGAKINAKNAPRKAITIFMLTTTAMKKPKRDWFPLCGLVKWLNRPFPAMFHLWPQWWKHRLLWVPLQQLHLLKSRKLSKGVESPRYEKSAKKKHRKRKIDSDESSDYSGCDPDIRA